MSLQREEGHRGSQESDWHTETQTTSQATSLQQPPREADTQHAESSYPHAVALEDIVPVERWGVQRVNWRWILHRAGKRRRAGTQTLRDLFMRSKEAQGTGTRREGRQLAATNRSTQKGREHTMGGADLLYHGT